MTDDDLMAVLNRRVGELGGAGPISRVVARYALGAHPTRIPVEQRAAFIEEVQALEREEPAVSPHAARLAEVAVKLAIELAEKRHPITKSLVPPHVLERAGSTLGWEPTRGEIIDACWEAVLTRRLVYHKLSSNRRYPTGFYGAPGPGGKGFD